MRLGERCSLCGGRLDADKRCTECGLDNRQSDRQYQIKNQDSRSRCDSRPLTHVHEDRDKKGRDKKDRKIRFPHLLAAVFIVICLILSGMVLWSGRESASSPEQEYEEDPYARAVRDLDAAGESCSITLGQGEYVVGTHIPEGTYTLTGDGSGFVSLSVDDRKNSIYLYESVDPDSATAEDIRLYTGAHVSVYGDSYGILTSENAQTDQLEGQNNPVTETVHISGGQTLTAGTDFTPGVYDFTAVQGYGAPEILIYDENGSQIASVYPWLSQYSEAEKIYRNVVLPEGAAVMVEAEELELELVPSQLIASENYPEYYSYY